MPLTEYSQQLIRAECNENHFAQIGTDGDAYRAKQGRWVSKEGGYYLSKEQGNSRGGENIKIFGKRTSTVPLGRVGLSSTIRPSCERRAVCLIRGMRAGGNKSITASQGRASLEEGNDSLSSFKRGGGA